MNEFFCFTHLQFEQESLWCHYTEKEKIGVYHRLHLEKKYPLGIQKVEDITLKEELMGYVRSLYILQSRPKI